MLIEKISTYFPVNGIFLITDHHTEIKISSQVFNFRGYKAKKNQNYKIRLKDSRPIRDFSFAEDYIEAAYKIMVLKNHKIL